MKFSILFIILILFISTIKSQELLILADLYSNSDNNNNDDLSKQPVCTTYLGGVIAKELECVFLNKYPTILSIKGDKIEIHTFNKTDYFCENEVIFKKSIKENECFISCPVGEPDESCTTFKFSVINEINDNILPIDTLVNVYYGSDCNDGDSWKSTFVWIEYYLLKTCDVTFLNKDLSFEISCNSTTTITNIYNAPTCFGVTSNIIYSPLYNKCGNPQIDTLNIIQICNLNNNIDSSSSSSSSNGNDK